MVELDGGRGGDGRAGLEFPFEAAIGIESVEIVVVGAKIDGSIEADSGRRINEGAGGENPFPGAIRIESIEVFVPGTELPPGVRA